MKTQLLRTAVLLIGIVIIAKSGHAQLQDNGCKMDRKTAIVIQEPQNDFLSPEIATWGVIGKSVTTNNAVENFETLFQLAEENGIKVFISPHYYYEHDHFWKFEGAVETLMHNINMLERNG